MIVRQTPTGEVVDTVRIDNDPVALSCAIAKAGPDPEVVIEATYGWYWAVDVLEACGAIVHLAHPLWGQGVRVPARQERRRDASDLADLLRMGRLPEAWIAPPYLRQLRELVRYRAKLVAVRSGLKAQVHAKLAKEGVAVPMSDLFGKQGMALLAEARLGTCYRMRVDSLLDLIDAFDTDVAWLSDAIAVRLRHHSGYHAIQQIPGIGPTFAAVFTVEIGDIDRFARPAQQCSWATPRKDPSAAPASGSSTRPRMAKLWPNQHDQQHLAGEGGGKRVRLRWRRRSWACDVRPA